MKNSVSSPGGIPWLRRNLWSLLVLLLAALLFLGFRLLLREEAADGSRPGDYVEYERGAVASILQDSTFSDPDSDGGFRGEQMLLVDIKTGQYKGEQLLVYNYVGPLSGVPVREGDSVSLIISTYSDGSHRANVFEYDRIPALLIVLGLFFGVTVLVGRKTGAKSLLALVITVAALLVFARLPERYTSRHRWVNYIGSAIMASFVAMLATVALSAHYFHTISFMSVLSNLLILPVLPFFMVLGALFLLVTAAGLHWPMLDGMLDGLYDYIRWAAGAVNAMPLSHMGGVYMSTFGVVAYFAVMALVVLWLYRRNYRYLLAAGVTLAVGLAHSLWTDAQIPRQGLIVFNSFTATPVLYYNHGTGYVWTPDEEDTDFTSFARYHAGFLARYHINNLRFITNDTVVRLDGALFKPPYAHLMGHRLVAVGSGQWKHATAPGRLDVDEIIVTKRYHGGAAKLQELYKFDRLILSGAMHATVLTPLLQECDSLSIAIHPLSRQGAYCIPSSQ